MENEDACSVNVDVMRIFYESMASVIGQEGSGIAPLAPPIYVILHPHMQLKKYTDTY